MELIKVKEKLTSKEVKGIVTIDLSAITRDNNITDLSECVQFELLKDKILEAVYDSIKYCKECEGKGFEINKDSVVELCASCNGDRVGN